MILAKSALCIAAAAIGVASASAAATVIYDQNGDEFTCKADDDLMHSSPGRGESFYRGKAPEFFAWVDAEGHLPDYDTIKYSWDRATKTYHGNVEVLMHGTTQSSTWQVIGTYTETGEGNGRYAERYAHCQT